MEISSDPAESHPGWASYLPHRCVIVRCSSCRRDLEDINQDGLPHFDSVEQARRAHLDYYGWTEDGSDLLCRSCTARRACAAAGGHDLELVGGLYRRCTRDRCEHVEQITPAEVDTALRAILDDEGAGRG